MSWRINRSIMPTLKLHLYVPDIIYYAILYIIPIYSHNWFTTDRVKLFYREENGIPFIQFWRYWIWLNIVGSNEFGLWTYYHILGKHLSNVGEVQTMGGVEIRWGDKKMVDFQRGNESQRLQGAWGHRNDDHGLSKWRRRLYAHLRIPLLVYILPSQLWCKV